ncbi:hypothetical protein KJ059_09570 [Myxococcota bacterium]|nr:hypothetical protein [Myxococcota bacterium]MCZ7617905.1 hypothetical protein [Myxococcota bacterium]
MRRIALALVSSLLASQTASADPSWSTIGITTTASNAPQVVAATDKLMGSEVGKTFPGKLLLQVNAADGANPATHTFVPIYKTVADREAFVQKLQGSPAWAEFQTTLERISQPGGTVMYQTLKHWGNVNDTDDVWMVHAFTVEDPAAFVTALDAFMASATGQKFPGQVYLSGVVAGGMTPVTHIISVGYESETEMAGWTAVRDASADWATYQQASRPTGKYLGGSLARDIKTWGTATLAEIVAP